MRACCGEHTDLGTTPPELHPTGSQSPRSQGGRPGRSVVDLLICKSAGSHAVPPSVHLYRPKASCSARQSDLFACRAAMQSVPYVPFQALTRMVSRGSSVAATE